MLKRYNFIKQLNNYRKALDSLKTKYGNISVHSERSQLLAESLKDSLLNSRVFSTAYSQILKINKDREIDGHIKKQAVHCKNKFRSQLELITRFRSILTEKKHAKVSFGVAGVASADDNLIINNLTADITSNLSTTNSIHSEVSNIDNNGLSNIESIRDKFEHNYDYVTVTFDPPVTSLDDKLIALFSETVTSVITDSHSDTGLLPDVNDSNQSVNNTSHVDAQSGTNVSVTSTSTDSTILAGQLNTADVIPEPPAIPDVTEFLSQLNALGQPTFESIGLGGWTPVGLVQHAFEYLHIGLGIPWWTAIVIGTVIIRVSMFPLVIIAQRNAAKMNNNLPGMQAIQLKMTEARQTGNQLDVARYSQELMLFMKEKEMNPFKNMIVPLAQMPIFISFFMGLRQMANVPVDSMRTGGLFWFTDLTVPDQFFALPIITSLTLWATIELGTDSARLTSQNLQTMKYVLRALPIIIIPFTLNFPGAILCYWAASNFISLAQVGFLKIPVVRDYFRIEPLIAHSASTLPVKNKGFVGGIKDSWTNIKITKELEERRRIDDLQFQRAGKGPIVKTYRFDPTKVTAASTIAVKKS